MFIYGKILRGNGTLDPGMSLYQLQ